MRPRAGFARGWPQADRQPHRGHALGLPREDRPGLARPADRDGGQPVHRPSAVAAVDRAGALLKTRPSAAHTTEGACLLVGQAASAIADYCTLPGVTPTLERMVDTSAHGVAAGSVGAWEAAATRNAAFRALGLDRLRWGRPSLARSCSPSQPRRCVYRPERCGFGSREV